VVFRAGCSYRTRLEALLAERGVARVRSSEFGTLEGILGCVAAGIGVTMLPRAVVEPTASGASLRLHTLPGAERWVDTVFIRRTDAFPSSAVAVFLALARSASPAASPAASPSASPPASPAVSPSTFPQVPSAAAPVAPPVTRRISSVAA
jgi:DNA-binding transcriptional LysR family regulator